MIQSCMIPRSQIIKLIYAMKLHTVHAKPNILPKHSSMLFKHAVKRYLSLWQLVKLQNRFSLNVFPRTNKKEPIFQAANPPHKFLQKRLSRLEQ